ncbi:mCG1051079, partial [Mus musculus]
MPMVNVTVTSDSKAKIQSWARKS